MCCTVKLCVLLLDSKAHRAFLAVFAATMLQEFGSMCEEDSAAECFCTFCGFSCSDAEALLRHQKSLQHFHCTECAAKFDDKFRVFSSQRLLDLHTGIFHSGKEQLVPTTPAGTLFFEPLLMRMLGYADARSLARVEGVCTYWRSLCTSRTGNTMWQHHVQLFVRRYEAPIARPSASDIPV
jgi:hypothetical protein